jgi:hypothetical protein
MKAELSTMRSPERMRFMEAADLEQFQANWMKL